MRMRWLMVLGMIASFGSASVSFAQQTETKIMPSVNAASTKVLVIPAVGGPGQTGGRVTTATDEVRYQFTKRGFQLLPEADTSAAVTQAGIDFTSNGNWNVDNFVKVGQVAGADFVEFTYVEKVKTFKPWEWVQPKIWNRWYTRSYVGPVGLARDLASLVGLGSFVIAPNSKHGSTIRTYLVDVRNKQIILFNHKDYGNSEGAMLGSHQGKWGPKGAVQDGVMFIMSRTLKDYK